MYLDHPVVIPKEDIDHLFSQGHGFFLGTGADQTAPTETPRVIFGIKLYQVPTDGERNLVNSLSYSPRIADEGAWLWNDDGWFKPDPAFVNLLNRYIASASRGGLPALGGPPPADPDDAWSSVWYIAPSLAAAGFFAAAAGRRLLRRPASGQ
ncbi:MAG: hypothetical protein HYS09_09395 [Chloroflexi bacterium]|nr:hypothetical protein [Chloroflexota bacterium]